MGLQRRQFGKFRAEAIPFWALIALLVLTFFTGGSSRADTQSLVILRPASVLFCGIGLWTLRLNHVRENRFLFTMAVAIIGLILIHLIPLPPSLWGLLPGRLLLTEIDKTAGLGAVWRPLTMAPAMTWNALFCLFAPLSVLIFGVQLTREERFNLLPIMLSLGLLSGFWSIMQLAGAPDGLFYLYSEAAGSADGLFRNRNHQATFLACLFPMLAVYASTSVRSEEQAGLRLWLAIAAGVILVPLILLTGSRAGLGVSVLGIISAFFFYSRPNSLTPKKRTRRKFDPRYVLAAITVLFLSGLSILMARAEAFDRLLVTNQGEEDRFMIWAPIAQMAWKYFPFGSGVGSFVDVYQIDEPHALLSPDYYNHAHNDGLEVYMTAGLPGLLLLSVAIFAFVRFTLKACRAPLSAGRAVSFARLGSTIIAILALASIADYPLRVPSLMCIFVIAALWLANSAPNATKNAGTAQSLGLSGPTRHKGGAV